MAEINEAYPTLRDPSGARNTTSGWPTGATDGTTIG